MKNNKCLYVFLLLFIIADLTYSFYQHFQTSLNGDLADIILPVETNGYSKVLKDPFGISVLIDNAFYPNPNRFFAHWTTSKYFSFVPHFLQNFFNPIDSVYFSAAILKIIVQIFILYLLAYFITNTKNIFNIKFLIAAAIITPLFQADGYNRFIGIIDQSVLYTIFYALPLGLLLLSYLPIYRYLFFDIKPKFNIVTLVYMIILMIIVSFNGPLGPGIVLIVSLLLFCSLIIKSSRKNRRNSFYNLVRLFVVQLPKYSVFIICVYSIISIYSLYIGRNNSSNFDDPIPLIDRYSKLSIGLFYWFTTKIGTPILLGITFINIFIIQKIKNSNKNQKL